MNYQRIRELEKKMEAGTELEKEYLNDYQANRSVPEEHLKYCQAWGKTYLEWERLINTIEL